MPVFLILILIAVGAAVYGYRVSARKRRRQELLEAALSDDERAIIADQVPLVRRLPQDLREKLEGKINLFLEQVEFQGCNGLDVTDEMALSIATQACLLVVNTEAWYDDLTTVMVYPGAFKSVRAQMDGYVVTETEIIRTGESWSRGPVILSWADSEQGAQDDRDGHNVVLHEFAHQLDNRSGHTDGVPLLNRGQSFAEWSRVFEEAYKRHVRNVEAGRRTVIDAYGMEGYEEFFATSVEVFFEKPARLRHDEPDVYEQLQQLFCLDPATWT